MLVGEVPEDPSVPQAIRKFLPVIEAAPTSLAAKGLLTLAMAVEQLIAAHVGRTNEEMKQLEETKTAIVFAKTEVAPPLPTSTPVRSEVPIASYASTTHSLAEPIRQIDGKVR